MAGIYIAAMSASRGNVLVSLITTTYVIVKHIENMNNVFVSDSLVQLQFNCEILRSALTSYSNRETLLYGYGTVLCCVHSFVKYQKAHTAKKYFSHSTVRPALGFCTLLRVVEETTHHTHTHRRSGQYQTTNKHMLRWWLETGVRHQDRHSFLYVFLIWEWTSEQYTQTRILC